MNTVSRSVLSVILMLVVLLVAPPAFAQSSPTLPVPALSEPDQSFKLARLVLKKKAEAPAPDHPSTHRHVVIVAVGDTGFGSHRAPVLAAGGYKHGQYQTWEEALSLIEDEIDGDFNFANLETVVTTKNDLTPVSKAYNFRTHPDAVRYLTDIGFNLYSAANNHSFDYGRAGILETIANLEPLAPDSVFAGIGRTIDEAAATPRIERNGVKLAFGAIGIGAGLNSAARASSSRAGQLAIYSKPDIDRLLTSLNAGESDYRPDYRVVSLHSGKERLVVPLQNEIALWRDNVLAGDEADMIIAHHTHVTRPVAMVDGRVIFFGLGNFAHFGTANMNGAGICRDYSIIARTHLLDDDEGRLKVAAIEIVPIQSTHMRPARMKPAEARQRIAVLNALAATADGSGKNSMGVRFSPQEDGTGLFCTALGRDGPPELAALCANYDAKAARALEKEVRLAGRCCMSYNCVTASRGKTKIVRASATSGKKSRKAAGKKNLKPLFPGFPVFTSPFAKR